MRPEDRAHFAPITAHLKDGRMITVRMLESTDGESLAEFYQTVPREDYRFYAPHPLTREAALQKAQWGADAPNFVCAVGLDAERIVGYAWYHWKEQDSPASGFGICIRRGFQEIGAGQAIMQRLFEVAREIGPPRMQLTVQKANVRALALYQKMGFTIVREQMHGPFEEFAAEPEYLMERASHATQEERS